LRITNVCPSRFLKFTLSDGSTFVQIANDGNLLESPVSLTALDEMGVAERYDIVVDFSRYAIGDKLWLVNLAEHNDGRRPSKDLTLAEALSGKSPDPGVGKVLEFRVARDPAQPDVSQVPAVMIPRPDRVAPVRERSFEFNRGGGGGGTDNEPWSIRTDGGASLPANVNRISALPKPGTAEIWHLSNGGGGWDHPIHIHFEECQTLARDPGPVPPAEALGRKDVWRLHPGGKVTLFLQFREFAGMFMEHCHNTVHEDHAMLLRWELDRGAVPLPTPIPTPAGVTFIAPEVLPEAL
jgi:FtsP/CotA-like multicopper oxidase with cupredoxin domain